IGGGFAFSKKLRPFLLYLNTNFAYPFKTTVDGDKVEYGNYADMFLTVELMFRNNMSLLCELYKFYQWESSINGVNIPDSDADELFVNMGVTYNMEKIQVFVGYRRVLDGKNTSAYDAFLSAISWVF
ncbi:MAG TPA: hypothetical protein VMW66_05110, partial [Elusimicrobiales bacterium]|nr:hypothetical protein [Elusimicrobiales bacterium]